MTETARAQMERQRDRRTARHTQREGLKISDPSWEQTGQRRREHRHEDNATEGQPVTDTRRGSHKFRPIMGATMTETE